MALVFHGVGFQTNANKENNQQVFVSLSVVEDL